MQRERRRIHERRDPLVQPRDPEGVDEDGLALHDLERHAHRAVAIGSHARVHGGVEVAMPPVEDAEPGDVEVEGVAVQAALCAERTEMPSQEIRRRRRDTQGEVAAGERVVAVKRERLHLAIGGLALHVLCPGHARRQREQSRQQSDHLHAVAPSARHRLTPVHHPVGRRPVAWLLPTRRSSGRSGVRCRNNRVT